MAAMVGMCMDFIRLALSATWGPPLGAAGKPPRVYHDCSGKIKSQRWQPCPSPDHKKRATLPADPRHYGIPAETRDEALPKLVRLALVVYAIENYSSISSKAALVYSCSYSLQDANLT